MDKQNRYREKELKEWNRQKKEDLINRKILNGMCW
jgi:predicted GIY-YIG superfamily endonuclease